MYTFIVLTPKLFILNSVLIEENGNSCKGLDSHNICNIYMNKFKKPNKIHRNEKNGGGDTAVHYFGGSLRPKKNKVNK